MTSNITLKSLSLRQDAVEAKLDRLIAAVEGAAAPQVESKGKARKAPKKSPKARKVVSSEVKPAPKGNAFRDEVIAKRAVSREFNAKASAWAHQHGIRPNGQAWLEIKAGNRNVADLKALNAADDTIDAADRKGKGKKGRKADAPKAPKREVAAKVEADKPAKAARPHRVNGSFMNAEEAKAYHRLTAEHGDTKAREIVAILFS
jgi:hypothetical protein